jgi:Uma2 family endonuclease
MELALMPGRRGATYEDLVALPPNVKGEILDGVLYTQPRPRFRHAHAASLMNRRIGVRYGDEPKDSGGWWIVLEPGIELQGSIECSPDVAGWRRDRLVVPPGGNEPITMAPDWVCEVLSPSTREYDLTIKKPFYAKHKVKHYWIVDPDAHQLIAFELQKNDWVEQGTWSEEDRVRIRPFPEVELYLGDMWIKRASSEKK